MTLPGIGEAKADAMISYRQEHGSFSSIEEIQNISGIKNAVFSKIKDRITV
jgi:competence protein ComEA